MSVKVSIIVPVYNSAKTLRRCADSILNQDFTDYELFLVDDGSTDDSGAICDEYAALDNRVNVIHKNNSGVSDTRNTALDLAHGKYIQFLDSDDWIEPKTCEETYKLGLENSADVVIFGTIQEFEHLKKPFKYKYENGEVFVATQLRT